MSSPMGCLIFKNDRKLYLSLKFKPHRRFYLKKKLTIHCEKENKAENAFKIGFECIFLKLTHMPLPGLILKILKSKISNDRIVL
jgi:hypothetical protein